MCPLTFPLTPECEANFSTIIFVFPILLIPLFHGSWMLILVYVSQVRSSKTEEKRKDGEKKRKKHAVIVSGMYDCVLLHEPWHVYTLLFILLVSFLRHMSLFFCPDSEEEEPVVKLKKSPKDKSPKGKQKTSKATPPPKNDPVHYVSETGDGLLLCQTSLHMLGLLSSQFCLFTLDLFWYFSLLLVDSDSDNFQSLKKVSKTKQNNTSKQTKSGADSARPGAKEKVKSPVRPSSAQGKTGVKSPPAPVTPKSAPPPQTKQTPTSVLDYFGSGTVQRSDKKLVASTKRKAVSAEDWFSSVQTF